ncbi:CBS domain-containing protein CBSX5-like [Nicotiana tabacum]|uniref:CBS domain-containing protein CBSX5-like n=2 Tax=Nicotiana TaxID=4085 RepID=A0A1S3YU45_TOBAC|nr:PREDICTED: CBS domain-containing protein CBSX5-like [Nicotiana sylvestris]XP_016455791.1 PREDICTED: CBS domain-containing protein CBSX5-like [Nicotiana tabacum]
MAVSFLNREVSDLCLGKPALKPIPAKATVSEALTALKKSGETHVSVWSCDHSTKVLEEEGGAGADSVCRCVGKISMVDVICFLSKEENLVNPSKALETPVAQILPKGDSIVRHLDPNSSLLEAIDYILEGAQNLVIPIQNYRSTPSRKRLLSKASSLLPTNHNGVEYCWLTQEDIVRFLLNSIGVFSPMPTFSIDSLNIINHDIMTVRYHNPAISSLDAITLAHIEQSSVAVVDEDNRLIGEISPFTLAYCDETVAAAIATLSAGDLMAYIDYGGPAEDLVELVKTRLQDKKLKAMVELLDEEFSLSSSSSSASSCSSDDESGSSRNTVLGRFSSARRSEAITCYPWSSLVAVMIQALAHRANSIWVMDADHNLIGVVTFKGILEVFRSIANARRKPERENTSKQ